MAEKIPTQRNRLNGIWAWLTAPHPALQEIGEQRSARLASAFTFAIALLTLVGFLASSMRVGFIEGFRTFGFTLSTSVVAYLISRTKYYKLGIFIFTLSFCASGFINVITNNVTGEIGSVILIYVPLGLIVASNFLPWPAVFLLLGLNVGAFFSMTLFGVTLPSNAGGLLGIITTIGVVLIVLKNYQDGIEKARLDEVRGINRQLEDLTRELEQRVLDRTQALQAQTMILAERSDELEASTANSQRRATQLLAIAAVSEAIATLQNIEELLPRITRVVSDQFKFYHVGIFLNDDVNKYAVLSATNSPGGQRMLARNHKLEIGATGIVGNVAATGKPRIALDTGADAVFFNNPDLPDTRSEMALPLFAGTTIIGVLDVQSTQRDAFSNEDIEILTILANQVSIAIRNTQLLEETQRSNADIRVLLQQDARMQWYKVLRAKKSLGLHYDGSRFTPFAEDAKSNPGAEPGLMTIPIRVRGQIIGRLGVKLPDGSKITQDEQDILNAVTERLAVSAENARLIEDSQERAAKEQKIGEIATKISASINLRSIMQTAVEELGRALPGSEVTINFETPK